MNEFSKATFSVLFIIKKSKLLKNGEAPIAMRITVRGQIAEVMIKRSTPIELWNQAKECSKGKDYKAKELNHYLETVKARIFKIQRELEMDGKVVTADVVKDRYYGRDVIRNQRTLVQTYSEHNERCRALIGIDFTKSTVDKFDTSLNSLKAYISHAYRKEDVLLTEIDGEFIRGLDFYMKTVRKCQTNSTIKHLKNLKKVIRIAISNGWIEKDPFSGIQFKHEEKSVEFLTQEELERLISKEFEIERLSQVRDVFVFCSMTALAFIDVKQLSSEHIFSDGNGAMWIRKPRQKTGTMCNVPLLSVAREILDKYADHPYCLKNNVLLPVTSNQKMNSYLKEIADLCGIKKHLCTHLARHTAATSVFLANNVSLENVSKILGHSSTKMTQHYAKVLDSSIMRDMAGVEKCFTKAVNQ